MFSLFLFCVLSVSDETIDKPNITGQDWNTTKPFEALNITKDNFILPKPSKNDIKANEKTVIAKENSEQTK